MSARLNPYDGVARLPARSASRRGANPPQGARDRQIFIARRLSDDRLTLAELATQHHISPERVRQIEHAVFELVSETLKKAVAREAVV